MILISNENGYQGLMERLTQSQDPAKLYGPSGFIEINGAILVVDYGRIYMDGSPAGFLYEDGVLKETSGLLGDYSSPRAIDGIPGCLFRGIDRAGMALELPYAKPGPTGSLKYNNIPLNVINGRLSTQDHQLVGELEDDGTIYVRDPIRKMARIKLDENTQLTTIFEGRKSSGQPWRHQFKRPLYRGDKSYCDNEIIRYFEGFDALSLAQKRYVIESIKLWASCGLLQIVRKSEGTAALGNVRHGVAGATGVRTGNVTLDQVEFQKEILLYKRHGPLLAAETYHKPFVEVRLNLVVAHEFGHQLEFVLSQATARKIDDLYEKRLAQSQHLFPVPESYEGTSELLPIDKVDKRLFISGYARQSMHEYWAESVACYSTKKGRPLLKDVDPEIYQVLEDLVVTPEKMVRSVLIEQLLNLQASLRIGGELTTDILDS